MKREGLPLKKTGEPSLLDSGVRSEVFEFTPEPGKEYVYKELRDNTASLWPYQGETLEEVASTMKKAYEILRRYCGDCLVPTHYLVTHNKEGDPCVMVVHEKVSGKELKELKQLYRDRPLPKRIRKQISGICEKAKEAGDDPESHDLYLAGKVTIPTELFDDIRYERNLIVDEAGKVWVVDW